MPKFNVARSIEINASPEKVYETIVDFNTWTSWSPWLCAEPDAKVNVTQNSNSVGSQYDWHGELVGSGEIEHKQLQPGKRIDDEIRFLTPWKSVSDVAFDFERVGEATKVTWHMNGSLPMMMFWMKGMMQTFIGMDYDRGLKMLKEKIETGKILSKTTVRGTESVGPLKMVGTRKLCEVKEVGPSMEKAFQEVQAKMEKHNLSMEGEQISVYHKFNMKKQTFEFTSGYVVPDSTEVPAGLESWSMPATEALAIDHVGSYDNLGNAWNTANQYARYKKLKQSKVGTYEIYRNRPEDTQPADLHTEIFLPLKSK